MQAVLPLVGSCVSFGLSRGMYNEGVKIKAEEAKIFANIIKVDELMNQNDNELLLLQHIVDCKAGILVLFKQVIVEKVDRVLVDRPKVQAYNQGDDQTRYGWYHDPPPPYDERAPPDYKAPLALPEPEPEPYYVEVKKHVPEFKLQSRHMVNPSFGGIVLNPQAKSFQVMNINVSSVPASRVRGDGRRIRKELSRFGISELNTGNIIDGDTYEYMFYNLKGFTLYFSGKKLGTKYLYNHFSTDVNDVRPGRGAACDAGMVFFGFTGIVSAGFFVHSLRSML